MLISEKLKELSAARAKLSALEESVAAERKQVLTALPAEYGFDSMDDFIDALREAIGKRRGRKPGGKKARSRKRGAAKRRKRAVITDQTRDEVRKLVDAGKTGTEIANTLRISLPSVQNIKKALGLVAKRK